MWTLAEAQVQGLMFVKGTRKQKRLPRPRGHLNARSQPEWVPQLAQHHWRVMILSANYSRQCARRLLRCLLAVEQQRRDQHPAERQRHPPPLAREATRQWCLAMEPDLAPRKDLMTGWVSLSYVARAVFLLASCLTVGVLLKAWEPPCQEVAVLLTAWGLLRVSELPCQAGVLVTVWPKLFSLVVVLGKAWEPSCLVVGDLSTALRS